MAVFLRHRFSGGVKTTIWKKYSVAYSGSAQDVEIYAASDYYADVSRSVTYYDGFNFPQDGTPTLETETTISVGYLVYTNANKFKGKIFTYNNYYFGTNDDATRGSSGSGSNKYYYVRKKGIKVTAATARSLAIAGDYIEDVESENPDEYPDNGPLGLYYYIKQ